MSCVCLLHPQISYYVQNEFLGGKSYNYRLSSLNKLMIEF